jgi:hypothetical protein
MCWKTLTASKANVGRTQIEMSHAAIVPRKPTKKTQQNSHKQENTFRWLSVDA